MRSSSKVAQAMLDQAVQSTEEGRFGEAGQSLLRVLEHIEQWHDGPGRSRELGLLAHWCSIAGHPDLALMALQRLLESEDSRSQPGRRCGDLLTLANSWRGLGRLMASSTVNATVLDHALRYGLNDDAASACTNLAILELGSGRFPQAFQRITESMELVKKGANPDTEAITRLTLIQIVDIMQSDPKVALDASVDLFTRLKEYVGPERWKLAEPSFRRVVDRYIAAHPGIDAESWKRGTFPLVFGENPA